MPEIQEHVKNIPKAETKNYYFGYCTKSCMVTWFSAKLIRQCTIGSYSVVHVELCFQIFFISQISFLPARAVAN